MQTNSLIIILPVLGLLAGGLAVLIGFLFARKFLVRARSTARRIVEEERQDAESKAKEILVAAQERALSVQEEVDSREHEIEERQQRLEQRARKLDREASEKGRHKKELERQILEVERRETEVSQTEARAAQDREKAERLLERNAGMTAEQARDELFSRIEEATRKEGAKLSRKIEDEARENAERQAANLMIQASQRVNIRDVVESTVSFIELPSDEMKGRIIGREGRNIRALEMATGIDLIVDDTPRSILISSFDPIRREIAKLAIDRLVQDGRIHPARIEEVVQRTGEDMESLVEEQGAEAVYSLGISDLHPRLVGLVGRMRYYTDHGQNLLRHCQETALIAGHMAQEIEARVDLVQRAGLLHEIGRVGDQGAGHPILAAAELCGKYGETEDVVRAVRGLQPKVEPRTVEALLLDAANRMSENRPGARKENLAVFIERLKRLEGIATGFSGVAKAYAVKAGKEIRVIVDAEQAKDEDTYTLSKEIAKALERDLSYPGQIKVSVVRETRAVRFAV